MNVLLINPPIREWAAPNCVPLGLAYVASVLRNAGHEVQVLDINGFRFTKEQVKEKLQRITFDVAGVGGIVTTANYIKWLVDTIKEYHPGKKIILGGGVSTSIPELILKKTQADIACIGEGEITAVELIQAMSKDADLKKVEGIYFKDAEGNIIKNRHRKPIKDIDSLPLPAYDLFPMHIYVNNPVGYINKNKWGDGKAVAADVPKSTNTNVTRGCPYRCIYCYHDFMGEGYRHHSAAYVLNEMKFLNKHYGANYFVWADDESMINKHFLNNFCAIMKKENTNFQFCISGRVNLVDRNILQNLKDAGCNMVGYGLESGSQKMLDSMKKDVMVEQAKSAVRLTREIFGDVDTTFVLGLPGEDEHTVEETIQFCKDIDLSPEAIFFATAYPGTELYQYAIQHGMIEDEFGYICKLWEQGEQVLLNFTQWSNEELFKKREWMIKTVKAWNINRHTKREDST